MEQDDNPQQPGLAETICLLVARARADVEQAVACKGIVDCTTGVAVVRQVLGKLILTNDGAVMADEGSVWYILPPGSVTRIAGMDCGLHYDSCYPRFSTQAAAQAALDAKEATQ